MRLQLLGLLCLTLGAAVAAAYPNINSNTQSKQPIYTYLTTSSTSSHKHEPAPSAMQPAIVYEASVPKQETHPASNGAASTTAEVASKKVIGSR